MIGPNPGMLIQPARRFILLRKLCDGALEPRDRFVEIPQLHHQRRQCLAHFKRDCLVAGLDQLGRSRALLSPCGAMTPTSVKWPRSPLRNWVRCVTNISRAL